MDLEAQWEHLPTDIVHTWKITETITFQKPAGQSPLWAGVAPSCQKHMKHIYVYIYIYIFFFKCHSFVLVHKLSNAWIYEYLKQVLQCTQGPGLVGVAIVSWLCSKLLARATSSTMV